MLIDTHAHLDFPDFADDLPDVLKRARAAGVTRILTIGTGLESSLRAVHLAGCHEEIFAVVGIHPSHAHEAADGDIEQLEALLAHPKVVAIGEIGLDFSRLPGCINPAPDGLSALSAEAVRISTCQERVFRSLLEVAARNRKNVVIHQRAAWDATFTILAGFTGQVRGVFHCFGENAERMNMVTNLGHLVSFTGIATFKNGRNVLELAASAPEDSFMVETDCPYLAPVPHRGTRCEPAHTRLVAEKIAEARMVAPDEIFRLTSRNAERFFGLPEL